MQNSTELGLPPGLAETEISIFANARATDPKPVKLGVVLAAIQTGRWADQMAVLRELLASGDKDSYDDQKKTLPAVTLSGSFEKRNAGGLIQHSGLLQIDLDHLDTPAEVRDQLATDSHIAAAWISPSAQGVKGVMLIPPNPERHKQSFKAAEQYIMETYGLETDKACKDVCRMMFVSHDPELRSNPDAVVLDVDAWTEPEPQASFDSHSEERSHDSRSPKEEAARVRDALTHISSEPYEDWIRFCAALKNSGLPDAFDIWHKWSAKASNYAGFEDCLGMWDGLKPNTGINVDAIYKAACDAGWNPMGQTHTHAKSTGGGWTEPQPLPKHPLPPPQLDPGVLPEPLAEYARAAALENEVAPEAVMGFLLASIGAVTGSRFCIAPDCRKPGWFEYPVRSTALVQPVSWNKTGAFKAGLSPLEKLQKTYAEGNRKAVAEALDAKDIHERKRRALLTQIETAQRKKQPTADLERNLGNLEAPDPAEHKMLVLSSGTKQKIVELASRGNERGLLLKRDELIGWFNELERSGGEGDREFFVEGMTVAHEFSHHTIGRGSNEVSTLALSVAGCVQPGKLASHLRAMESGERDDGLMQRFLWVWPSKPSFGSFDSAHAEGFRGVDPELQRRVQEFFGSLDDLRPDQIGTQQSSPPAPVIGFDDQAQHAFLAWRELLRTQTMEADDLPDGQLAWLGKSERLVAGLALSFHCIECALRRRPPGPVALPELSRAVDCWDVLRHHAFRVFDMGRTSPVEAAHLLCKKLKRLVPEFSLRELKRKGWSGLRGEGVLEDALDLLTDFGYLKELDPPKNPRVGRPPSRRFLVNPNSVKDA